MSTLPARTRPRHRHRAKRKMSPALVVFSALMAVLLGIAPAAAYWGAKGSGSGSAVTGTVSAPVGVTVPTDTTTDVPISWSAGAGGIAPTGYFVTRQTGGTSVAACASSPTNLIHDTACTDTSVPDGQYSYVVTAVYASWTTASVASALVNVANTLLGTAARYSVLAGTAVVNTGTTTISGDLGVSPGTSITGFTTDMVGGEIHAGDAAAAAAATDLTSAYDELASRTADEELAGEVGGLTFVPGVYHAVAALAITGTLTLDAQGDPDAVFVFQTDAAFNTAASSIVNLVNGAQAANVFWVVAGAAGTGANSFLSGTILARGAITLGASTLLIGRALSLDAVTIGSSTIRFTDALPPTLTILGGASSVTKDTTPTISGTSNAPASSPITVTVAGQTLSTTVGTDGTWTVTATTALAAGVYDVVAKVRAPSGNGAAAFQTMTVEVNPPTVVLGTAGTYSVLGTGVVNTGATTLSGDLGVSPDTSVTGFPPGTLAGTEHTGDADAAQAQNDLIAAIDDASSRTPHTQIIGDLGGRTFHIGVHHASAALALTGTVTLDAEGNPDAVFIFQTDAAFNTAAASTVNLVNGAQAANVFWVVAGAAGTGANSFLSGTILARGAITLGADTELTGGALSRDVVTMASDVLIGVAPGPVASPARAGQLSQLSTGSTGPTTSDQPTTDPSTPTPTTTDVSTTSAAPPPTSTGASTTAVTTEPDGTTPS